MPIEPRSFFNEAVDINWNHEQSRGLVLCYPLVDKTAKELVSGRQKMIPHNAKDVAGPVLWVGSAMGWVPIGDGVVSTGDSFEINEAPPYQDEPFSMTALFNTKSISLQQCLFWFGDNAAANRFHALVLYNGGSGNNNAVAYSRGTTVRLALSQNKIQSINKWYHGGAVFRSDTNREGYLNGVGGTPNVGSAIVSTVNRMTIMRYGRTDDAGPVHGSVCDVRLYNRDLSDEELYSFYRNPHGLYLRPKSVFIIISGAVDVTFAANLTGTGDWSTDLSVDRNIAAALQADGDWSTDLNVEINMAITLAATSDWSTDLNVDRNMAINLTADSDWLTDLSVDRSMAVALQANSDWSTDLSILRAMAVNWLNTSDWACALDVTTAGDVEFAINWINTADWLTALSVDRNVEAALTVDSDWIANLNVEINLAANWVNTSDWSNDLSVDRNMAAVLLALSTWSTDLSLIRAMVANLVATSDWLCAISTLVAHQEGMESWTVPGESRIWNVPSEEQSWKIPTV